MAAADPAGGKRGVAALLALAALVTSGCATPVRWAGEAYVDDDAPWVAAEPADPLAPDCARLAGGPTPTLGAPAAAPVLWVTSTARAAAPAAVEPPPDRTEAAFYNQVGAHTGSLAAFLAAVHPPRPAADAPDFASLQRTLTIAVHRTGYRPADRFERVHVIVKAVNFRFVDPAPNGTAFDVADLGHLTQASEASGTVNAAAGSAAGAGAAVSRSQTFDRELRQRLQDVDITVAPRFVRIYREGAPGRDLTGAFSLPLSIEPVTADLASSEPVVVGLRLPGAAGQAAGVDTAVLRSIARPGGPVAPLWACAQVRYVERRVVSGQRYLDEGRQKVRIMAGATPWTAYEIVPAEDLRPPLFRITAGSAIVTIMVDGAPVSDFLDQAPAAKLRDWLARSDASRLGTSEVRLGGSRLTAAQRARLAVTRVQDQAAPPPSIEASLIEPARPVAAPGRLD